MQRGTDLKSSSVRGVVVGGSEGELPFDVSAASPCCLGASLAASLARAGSCELETCATCRLTRKRSYNASSSSLSGSSFDAPT